MESIERVPDAAEAREALAGIERAQRAVRDTPWPTWIYPVNAVLLGGMVLTFLLREHGTTALLAVAVAVIGVNVTAGYRMGAAWTLPTSRAFLAAVAASILCVVVAAIVAAGLTEPARPVVVLAIVAALTYLAGGVAHRRSTGRPR